MGKIYSPFLKNNKKIEGKYDLKSYSQNFMGPYKTKTVFILSRDMIFD